MNDLVTVEIEKLIEGGQGLGTLPNGKKVFVWNALPGEQVGVRIIKQRSSYAEAIAEEIITASPERMAPLEENYLATSPWQMMTFAAENRYKQQLAQDIFRQAKLSLPPFQLIHDEREVTYRNKIEFGFWGDDDGLHLASYRRGSHAKLIVTGSQLAMPAVDYGARLVRDELRRHEVRASDLKTIVVRCSQTGTIAAALFVKNENFPELQLPDGLHGLQVYYSNPKSPASVPTRLMQTAGSPLLRDTLLGNEFVYDVNSFFQVNIPIYEQALRMIRQWVTEPAVVDLYAGVGTIGLSAAQEKVTLVEIDAATAAMAGVNAAASGMEATVIETPTERALDHITGQEPVVVDPPRAGLHAHVTTHLLATQPAKIVYLSCNPTTQARDVALLQPVYEIKHFTAFNFFPRTPHIETLVILVRR